MGYRLTVNRRTDIAEPAGQHCLSLPTESGAEAARVAWVHEAEISKFSSLTSGESSNRRAGFLYSPDHRATRCSPTNNAVGPVPGQGSYPRHGEIDTHYRYQAGLVQRQNAPSVRGKSTGQHRDSAPWGISSEAEHPSCKRGVEISKFSSSTRVF